MRVLLISPNQVSFAHRITPVGLLYLAEGIRQKGHKVDILDLMFSQHPQSTIKKKLVKFNPEMVGISLRNLDTMISKGESLLSYQQDCLTTVQNNSKASTILGGPGFTIAPELIMNHFSADFGISGEADNSFPELIDRIEKHQDYRKIPGLIYREKGKLKHNPSERIPDLNRIPFQAIDLINIRKYRRKRGFIGVLIKRSCTQQCIFCDEQKLYGTKLRFRSPEIIADEIEYLCTKTGMKYFDFADALFNSPRHHMVEVLRSIISRNLNIKFKVELNPVGQDEESVSLLKRAGCIGVDYSPDSGSDIMLKNYNKGFTTEDVLKVAHLYSRYNIRYSAGFLLGGPGENLRTIKETIGLAGQLPKVNLVYFTVGLTIGGMNSKMEKKIVDKAIIKSSEPIEIKYYLDEGFNSKCAIALLNACRRNPVFYISDTFLSGSLSFFWKLSDILNVRPIWKYGRFPSKAQRILKAGKNNLVWKEEKRRFIPV